MKTIEQAASEYAKNKYPNRENPLTKVSARINFRAGVEFAQSWISIDEELPELTDAANHNAVNVKYKNIHGEIRVCTATLEPVSRHSFENSPVDFRWFVYPSAGHELRTVTHWRPIDYK